MVVIVVAVWTLTVTGAWSAAVQELAATRSIGREPSGTQRAPTVASPVNEPVLQWNVRHRHLNTDRQESVDTTT